MASILDQIEKAQGGAKLTFPVLSPKTAKESEFLFRALPYKHGDDGNPFIEIHVHNNIGKDGKEYALCPDKTTGEDCPYCASAKELKDKLEAEEWKKIAKKFYPSSNVYIPGIVRYAKYSEFAVLKVSAYQNFQQQIIGILTDKQLKKLFKLGDNVNFIRVFDLKQGLDFVVKKLDKSKESIYEKFEIKSELELSPVIKREEEKEILKRYWDETPNIVSEMVEKWGCFEKINGIFARQHPDTAVKMGLISKNDVKPKTPAPSETVKEDILPVNDSNDDSPNDVSDDMDDLINQQIDSNDKAQNSSAGNPTENIDDEFEALMNDLNKK